MPHPTFKKIPATALKRTDILHCIVCKQGLMHDNNMTFFEITIAQKVFDLHAVDKAAAFDQLMGNPVIEHAMGLDEDLALPAGDAFEVHVCMHCALETIVAELSDIIGVETADSE